MAGFPGAESRCVVVQALGQPAERMFGEFDQTPFAVASIAQVHHARLLIQILRVLAKLAPPLVRYDIRFQAETDLRKGAANVRWFVDGFREHPYVHVPDVELSLRNQSVLVRAPSRGRRIDDPRFKFVGQRSLFARQRLAMLMLALAHRDEDWLLDAAVDRGRAAAPRPARLEAALGAPWLRGSTGDRSRGDGEHGLPLGEFPPLAASGHALAVWLTWRITAVAVALHQGLSPGALPLEIVEREGLGHPETVCDAPAFGGGKLVAMVGIALRTEPNPAIACFRSPLYGR